jgi:hypothetical protein
MALTMPWMGLKSDGGPINPHQGREEEVVEVDRLGCPFKRALRSGTGDRRLRRRTSLAVPGFVT